MAHAFSLRSMSQGYIDLIEHIIHNGTEHAPRGMKTVEIEDAVVVLDDPREAMPNKVGRKLSFKILAAESMQWLAGVSDLAQLAGASKNKFVDYSDDGTRLYGAYGPRAHKGLSRAVRLLADDPDSRQAIVSLWNNEETDTTKDLPCTLSWAFRIRDGRLNMSTVMRSWDVWTGVAYDLPAMTRIQSAVVWALDVPVGTYHHTAHSLHIYARDMPPAGLLKEGKDHHKQPPMLSDNLDRELRETGVNSIELSPIERWSLIQDLALRAIRGEEDLPSSFAWYANHLRGLPRNPHFCDKCRYFLPSGELFCYAD